MKAPRFSYAKPASVAEALALLDKYRDDARVLAGGQSLVPMLNFRLAALGPIRLAERRLGRIPGPWLGERD